MEDLKWEDPYSHGQPSGLPPIPRFLFCRESGLLGRRVFFSKDFPWNDAAQDIGEERLVTKELEATFCQLNGQHTRSTFLMVFSPDKELVASTHGDHNIYISVVKTGKCCQTLRGHPRTPWCVAFHPSFSGVLASGCLGGVVRVWDIIGGGSEVWRASSVIASLAFHPTDKLLVVATCNQLHFWDWSVRGTPIIKIATKSEKEKVRYVKFDSKGHYLITGIANLYNAAASTADRATVSTSNRHESSAMILDPLHIRPDDREPVSMSRYGRYRRMSWLSSLASNTGATIVNRNTDRGTDASIQSGRSMAAPAEQDVAAPPTSSTASQTLSDLAAAASSQLMVENAAASSSADAVGSSAASDSIDEPLPFTHSPQSSFRAVVNDVPWSSANSGLDMNAIFSEPLGNRETLNDNYGLMPWPQGPAGNQNFRANRNRIEELIQERDSLVNQLDDFRSMQQRASGEADPWRHVDPWAVDSRFSSETVVARGRSGGSRRLAHDMPAPSSTSTFTHRSSSTARLLPNNDHTYTQRLQDNAFASGNENATDEDSHALHNANGDDEGDDIGRNGDSSSILSNMDIELLSRHIFHMQRICRASLQDCTRQRRQVIRLQSIRKNLEDLQRQIRSLRSVAVERLSRLEDVIDRRGLQDSDRRISDNSSLAVGLRTRSRRNILDLESNFDERQGEGEHLAPLRHSMNARLSSALVRLRRSKRSHYLRAHYRLLSQMRATFRAFEMSPDLSSRAPSRSRSPTQLPAAPEQPQSQADSYEYSSCSQQPAAVNSESETVLPLVSSERCQNDKSVDSAGVSTRSELRAISQRLERILRTQREALGSPDVANDCSLDDDESSWIRPPASNSTLDFHDSESESDNDASLSEPSFGFSSRLPTRYTGSSLTACPGSPRSTINNYLSAIRMSGQIYRSWERQRQARHFFFQRRRQRLFGSYAGRSHSSHSGIFTPSVGSYHGLLEADDDDDEEDGDGDRDSQSANAFDRGTSSTGLPAVDEEDEVNQDRLPPLREIIWRRLRRRNAQLNMLDDDLTSSSNANQHHLAEAQQRRQGLLDQQQPQQRPEVRQSQQPRLGQHRSTRDREFLSFMVDQMRLDQNETIASRGSTSVPSSSASSSSGMSAAPPSHVPAPTVPPPAMPTEIVSRFQSWSGLMADVPVPPAPSNAHVPAQPVIANPREQQFILHNTPACMLLTHRIQCWHVHKGHLPSIEDANRNVIVKEAKIHNDASVDISEDGSILVTLVPSNMPMITVVGVYGLQPDFHRGRCYATYSLYSSAVSVSLSPTSRYLLVGLAFRTVGRISISPAAADRSLMAQIFRIHTHWDRGKLVPRRDLHLISMADSSILNQTSLNCIRWIPSAGNGIVYATNTGLLNILK